MMHEVESLLRSPHSSKLDRTNQAEHHAFTLIEVLVVVAIIALLVAILLPSLARARAQVRHTKCLSNVRQSGMAMQMYVAANKGWIPRAGDAGNSAFWANIVAKELNLVQRMPTSPDDLQVDKMEILHCPDRVGTLPSPFIDYVVNSMVPDPIQGSNIKWSQIILDQRNPHLQWCSLDEYKRPSTVVYVVDAAREDKALPFAGFESVKEARENWQGISNGDGMVASMDVFLGGHLPQGKPSWNAGKQNNTDDGPGPRRAARKMHLNRFTNGIFMDGHAEGIQLANLKDPSGKPDHVANYAYWLKLFGVQDALNVAKLDNNGF